MEGLHTILQYVDHAAIEWETCTLGILAIYPSSRLVYYTRNFY
jgi:hypothetical protein